MSEGSEGTRVRHRVIGTAGHIDHGKSALVRALTGTDPDRLKEEKRRGITIELGFADLELAPGDTTLRTHSLWAAMHGSEHFRKREGRHGPSADGLRAELIEALLGYWARPSSSTG